MRPLTDKASLGLDALPDFDCNKNEFMPQITLKKGLFSHEGHESDIKNF